MSNEFRQTIGTYNFFISKNRRFFMAQTVIGFFDNAEEGRRAVNQLQEAGIGRDNVDMTENSGTETVGNDRGVGNSSRCIVTVHARSEEEAERAADILDSCGAIDVDERASQYGSVASDRSADSSQRRETTIPRVQENLEVGKRTEERGGVRVRSRIVESPVEEHVRLREERVNVDRQQVNRPVSPDDGSSFKERNIELTERTEVPVVNKEARVVEEIRVSKDVSERDETIRDTVRNTEVDIENTDGRTRRNLGLDGRRDSSL
jgi:stress response protein YsnF